MTSRTTRRTSTDPDAASGRSERLLTGAQAALIDAWARHAAAASGFGELATTGTASERATSGRPRGVSLDSAA